MPTPGGLVIPGDRDFRIGSQEVNRLHDYDDVDTDKLAHHHTIGPGKFQAASGSHHHRLPTAWYRGSVAQSIPANAWTRLELATKIHLSSEYFTFNDVNDQIEVKQAGLYLVMARCVAEAGGGGQRYMRLRFGNYGGIGISWLGRINDGFQSDSNELSDTAYIDLVAGQYAAIDLYSTGATTTRASATADEYMFTQLQMIRLGDWN